MYILPLIAIHHETSDRQVWQPNHRDQSWDFVDFIDINIYIHSNGIYIYNVMEYVMICN
jgi:hypothetical protein